MSISPIHTHSLMCAIYRDDDHYLGSFLRKSGTDPNSSLKGRSLISWAVFHGKTKAIRLLYSLGVDLSAKSLSGESLGETAVLQGRVKVIETLADCGYSFSVDAKGISPLMIALSRGNLRLAQVLCKTGVDSQGESEGFTAYGLKVVRNLEQEIPEIEFDPLASEMIFRKVLGHTLGIEHISQVAERTCDSTGMFSPYMHKKILESLSLFFQRKGGLFSCDEKECILRVLSASLEKLSPEELGYRIQQGIPTLVSSGWSEHTVDLLFVSSCLFICNGGEKPLEDKSTVAVYPINLSLVTARKMRKILRCDARQVAFQEGSDFFYRQLPKMLARDWKPMEKAICHSIQSVANQPIKVGICSYAAGKIAFRVLGLMLKLQNLDPRQYKGMAQLVKIERRFNIQVQR